MELLDIVREVMKSRAHKIRFKRETRQQEQDFITFASTLIKQYRQPNERKTDEIKKVLEEVILEDE